MGSARAAALLLLAAAAPALADTVLLQNGTRVEGLVVEEGGERVVVRTLSGTQTFPKAQVKSVEPSPEPARDFERHFKALGKKDAAGAFALAGWAGKRGIEADRKRALEKAIAIDPNHAAAREALGFVRVEGAWMTKEDAERFEASRLRREELLAHYQKMMGARPEVLVSAHWECVDFLGDGKAQPRVNDLEKAWDAALEMLGPPNPWAGHAKLIAFKGLEEYRKWVDAEAVSFPGMSPQFLGFVKAATGLKWHQPAVLARSDQPDTGAMHAANVHAAGHLLVNLWKGRNMSQPFWIEEGFGGWMEDRILKTYSSYCFEVKKKVYGGGFRGTEDWDKSDSADWKQMAKDAAGKSGFLPLDQFDTLPRGDYGKREVAQSFSLVAFLLQEKGVEDFRKYLTKVKGGAKSALAAREVYGADFEGLEPAWKKFVVGRW